MSKTPYIVGSLLTLGVLATLGQSGGFHGGPATGGGGGPTPCAPGLVLVANDAGLPTPTWSCANNHASSGIEKVWPIDPLHDVLVYHFDETCDGGICASGSLPNVHNYGCGYACEYQGGSYDAGTFTPDASYDLVYTPGGLGTDTLGEPGIIGTSYHQQSSGGTYCTPANVAAVGPTGLTVTWFVRSFVTNGNYPGMITSSTFEIVEDGWGDTNTFKVVPQMPPRWGIAFNGSCGPNSGGGNEFVGFCPDYNPAINYVWTGGIPHSQWQMLSVVYSLPDGYMRVYMGNATTSMAQLASEGLPDDQMPVWQFCVGNTGPGTVPWFGYYDEVRVSNVALPLAELESVRRMVFHTGLE